MDAEYERSTPLFESERDIIREAGSTPYDLTGNIAGTPFGTEIDPALSAQVGSTVLVNPVPTTTTTPGLAAFAAVAGDPRTVQGCADDAPADYFPSHVLNAFLAAAACGTGCGAAAIPPTKVAEDTAPGLRPGHGS